jgi:hypothetical protein
MPKCNKNNVLYAVTARLTAIVIRQSAIRGPITDSWRQSLLESEEPKMAFNAGVATIRKLLVFVKARSGQSGEYGERSTWRWYGDEALAGGQRQRVLWP